MPKKMHENLIVTPENFGDVLVESARQAFEIARRDAPELRMRVRGAILSPPPPPPDDTERDTVD